MRSWLTEADRSLLYLINKKLSFDWLNSLMLILREAITWIPLYLFFLLFFYINCRKFLGPIVILSILTFAITDYTSASIIKPYIGRLRPCQDAAINFQLNHITGCGGLYSMPSSHASNHFGLATFWYIVIKHTLGSKWTWLWLWAFIICYAQVYVGVHYPFDVLAGAVLGTLVGWGTGALFIKRVSLTVNRNDSK